MEELDEKQGMIKTVSRKSSCVCGYNRVGGEWRKLVFLVGGGGESLRIQSVEAKLVDHAVCEKGFEQVTKLQN